VAEAGVLGGKAGNSDATGALIVVSKLLDLEFSLADCVVRLRLGAVVVTARLPVDLGPDGVNDGVEGLLTCFFAVAIGTAMGTGLVDAEGFVGRDSLSFPASSEGKSSDCKLRPP